MGVAHTTLFLFLFFCPLIGFINVNMRILIIL
jgi:hypothetical protein